MQRAGKYNSQLSKHGTLDFLPAQWPGPCSVELISSINAAATNSKPACKSCKIYHLKAGIYFFQFENPFCSL